MLNLESGQPIAQIISGKHKGEIIFLDKRDGPDRVGTNGCQRINLRKGKLMPLLNTEERQVAYVAGPSGSGKTTYTGTLAKNYKKIFPGAEVYLFSRTDYRSDPVYKMLKLRPLQVMLDETLVTDPIDIETELKPGSLIMFDDIGTINNDQIRKAVNALAMDIMEVGRKLDLTIILTSHLVNPTDRKFSRVIHNEYQTFTFFPKSGSFYQIEYCLKNYFGFSKKQIREIMDLPSRWVTIMKNYPQCVLHEHGCYLL